MTDDGRSTPDWFSNGTVDQSDAHRSPTEAYGQAVGEGMAGDRNWFGELEMLETEPADASVPDDDGAVRAGGETGSSDGGAAADGQPAATDAGGDRPGAPEPEREPEREPEPGREPDAAGDDEPIGAGAVVDGESTPEPGAAAAAANDASTGQDDADDAGLIAWLKSLFGV